ncbi:hypothetical protein [Methylobacterium sp. J-090]|uniref:hypothetical protein n=1 Tax=Methylobacterium sp. J-090 TaxID=2836666 RepID=UPI001FB938B2|nr:hypothetical protein [Methylobacterium sp. J-090]MCJ2080128.1 hypothetical protein [Methylobacterium sp. J-090]
MAGGRLARTGGRLAMPFRHKLMLLLAVELVAIGFQQAERNPYRPGITVEVPDRSGHVIT